jgi:WD40 repeat protein
LWEVATGKPVLRLDAHTDTVTSVAFSPDGKHLATGSFDTTVRLWDATGKELHTVKGHTRTVRSVTFSPDGKTLASGSFDNTVRLWDVATAKEVAILKGQSPIMSVAFSPDGRLLATGSGGKQGGGKPEVKLWELRRGKPAGPIRDTRDSYLRPAGEPEKPEAVVPQPVRAEDGRSRINQTDSGATHLAFTPDGKRLLTAHRNGIVRTWDVASGKPVRELKSEVPLMALAVAPDGRWIAVGTGIPAGGVVVWDLAAGKKVWQIYADKNRVTSLAFSPDGKRLASGDDVSVRQWDAATGKEVRTFPGFKENVLAVAFSPDGRTVAAAGSGEVKLLDVETGKVVLELKEATRGVSAVAFSPDGKTLAAATDEAMLMLWDVRTGKILFTSKGHKLRVTSVAFSPDGKTLATGSGDGTVRLWDMATGKERETLTVFQGEITSVAFSPDGRLLAAAGSTRTDEGKMGAGEIRLWDLQRLSGRVPEGSRGGGTKPPEAATPGPRLNKLLDELLQSKRSDEQVLEALFLAALGRFPTDAEQKFALEEVAKKKDRREAFGNVLYVFLSTPEFKEHVEELNRALPRRLMP